MTCLKPRKIGPEINFIIYHAAFRPFLEAPDATAAEFEKTGYIRWASDLAAIPEKYGVDNVYAEIGTSFANCVVTNPRLAAGLLGTLIKGMGVDKVIWGTDSVWYGSPQWQIEAFRRLEIPQDLQKKFGFAPLGAPDGDVKNAIFGLNAAPLYDLKEEIEFGPFASRYSGQNERGIPNHRHWSQQRCLRLRRCLDFNCSGAELLITP